MFTMVYYYIVCRSLTYAQRTANVLSLAGITGYIQRSPAAISTKGCSHSVRISQKDLSAALQALKRANLTPEKVFVSREAGGYREVFV